MEESVNGAADDDGELMCRYCFEGAEEGELIAPCDCSGGQKYVHLSCLRRWQRMVLVTQPTHPRFYKDDIRQHRCNVCRATFSCPPPTRHELMESFTGPELAALLAPDCVIASHHAFSAELERQLEAQPVFFAVISGYDHWLYGVYLVTSVEPDEAVPALTLAIESDDALERFRDMLEEDGISLRLSIGMSMGEQRQLRVVPGGSLPEHVRETDDIRQAITELHAPASIELRAEETSSQDQFGRDHIAAVNITRQLERPRDPSAVEEHVCAAIEKLSENTHDEKAAVERIVRSIRLTHYNGGPCEEDEISCCVMLGGRECGWTSIQGTLTDALVLAARIQRESEQIGDSEGGCDKFGTRLRVGCIVRVTGLVGRSELNGLDGVLIHFNRESKRWDIRLGNGAGIALRAKNIKALQNHAEEDDPQHEIETEGERNLETKQEQVMVFWGCARWSRTQLLGEVSRGSWGLCQGSVRELIVAPKRRRDAVDSRLVFAPHSEMTDDFMRLEEQQMEALHRTVVEVQTMEATENNEFSAPSRSNSVYERTSQDNNSES
eukprot:CAMPEP_0182442454 /NCGR_PEP_ID=MMETSP1172-20130603/1367_1 /TAXON_ID=708627 /ORGANISM="Timspurckia oligopyrenoides, Strain CCMP3278" /LENGTH=551 /DNA_ID=CAMNT_0024637319 /DNA_START=81 /DNA_END=1736 /DNA_ORIENTATION=-